MNWKNLVSLLVAIVMGLAALWIGRNLIVGKSPVVSEGNFVDVIVATRDLDPGHLIEPADVSTMRWPAESVTRAVFTDDKAVVGRALLTPVVKGQTMFETLLAEKGSEGGLTALVPDGMRAVAVEITESSGVGWMLVPGCHVDVIATLRPESGELSRTIVENVKVQAVGQRLVRERADGAKGESMKTVTLIVTPKDAETIELAGNGGRLRLVLRGANDTKSNAGPGVRLAELTGGPILEPAQPTTKPSGGFLSLLAALASMPTTQPSTPMDEELYVRRAERIIRGGSEGTVYYQRRTGTSSDDGWNITSVVTEKAEPKGLFK